MTFPSLLSEAVARAAVDAAVHSSGAAIDPGSGRGIVIPAGGPRYFPSAWVCIRTLRDLGCELPVELWYVGEGEMDAEMRSLVAPLGVTCVDAEQVARLHPVRFVTGWPLKAFALQYSGFREVLLLDADNMPLVDPTFLYEEQEYRSSGAIFWPDKGSLGQHKKIWELMGVEYRDEPAVESGQLLVDRYACRDAVRLAAWMNCDHGDFWYQYIYGDKDTFHLAWRKLSLEYAMPRSPIGKLPHTMIQHDFGGRAIFQHRHGNKWSLDSQVLRIPGFRWENRCRAYLAELRHHWPQHPARPYRSDETDEPTRAVADSLTNGSWSLATASRFCIVKLTPDGRVIGGCPRERHWSVRVHEHDALLSITGMDSLAWLLARGDSNTWAGRAPAEPGRSVRMDRVR